MNSHAEHFDHFLKKLKENKETSKKEILWHGVHLCVLVDRKNYKFDFCQTLQKITSQKVYNLFF